LLFISCNKDDINVPITENEDLKFISAAEVSRYPEISNSNLIFYGKNGN
jgi:hypothetical protein